MKKLILLFILVMVISFVNGRGGYYTDVSDNPVYDKP